VNSFSAVHGFANYAGSFTIELSEIGVPENDCRSAIALEAGDVIEGSTLFAGQGENVPDFVCGLSYSRNITSPGVFYTVEGSGDTMAAVLSQALFVSQITVFAGDDCDSLSCVDGDRDNGTALVVWGSVEGQQYYIYVHGDPGEEFGKFELAVESNITRPPNDDCGESIPVEIGDTLLGSTKYAAASLHPRACFNPEAVVGIEPFISRSVWYTISGSALPSQTLEKYGKQGGAVYITANITSYNNEKHTMVVYSGANCATRACVTSSSGGVNRTGAYVTWEVNATETYYVAIFPIALEGLDFELEIGAIGVL
jgi:hypothetical protein